ncbi:hypothetical protein BIU98_13915 [Curtobacterium sp. MMLR14_010]|nr:hypothetical protein BIU98_13915 [Curtobacterium sp. MMLR14_010]
MRTHHGTTRYRARHQVTAADDRRPADDPRPSDDRRPSEGPRPSVDLRPPGSVGDDPVSGDPAPAVVRPSATGADRPRPR